MSNSKPTIGLFCKNLKESVLEVCKKYHDELKATGCYLSVVDFNYLKNEVDNVVSCGYTSFDYFLNTMNNQHFCDLKNIEDIACVCDRIDDDELYIITPKHIATLKNVFDKSSSIRKIAQAKKDLCHIMHNKIDKLDIDQLQKLNKLLS